MIRRARLVDKIKQVIYADDQNKEILTNMIIKHECDTYIDLIS